MKQTLRMTLTLTTTSTLTGTAIENVNESKTLLVTWNKNVKLILMPILMHC